MQNKGIVQFIKFGIVGASNTAVDWVVFYVLTAFIMTDIAMEPLAKTISFIVAVLNSFYWNSVWTFRKEFKAVVGSKSQVLQKGGTVFVRFFIVSLIGWGVNYLAFRYTRFDLDQSKIVALIVASGVAVMWNFIANKLWTYNKKGQILKAKSQS